MLAEKKIIVIMPGHNVAPTIEETFKNLPHDIIDEIVLIDDGSTDETGNIAKRLGMTVITHKKNGGYGAAQKTGYRTAMDHGADIVVMVHPDYQYEPRLTRAMSSMIAEGPYDAMLASRIIGGRALSSGMPIWRYISNRFLTAFQNLLTGGKLSEFHTGFRAFSRKVISELPLEKNSDDFVFDNQMLAQILNKGFLIGELSCPTKYFPEASSINLVKSIKYGLGVLWVSVLFRLNKLGIFRSVIFTQVS